MNMTDQIVPILCKHIHDAGDGWIRVTWETTVNGRLQHINSGYGPQLRDEFLDSVRRLQVDTKQLAGLINRPNVFGRIYKSSRSGNLQIDPHVFESSSQKPTTATPLVHQPLAKLASQVQPIPTPPSNPIDELKAVVSQIQTTTVSAPAASSTTSNLTSAKSLAGFKGGDTKTLKTLVKSLESFLNREDVESRLDNPQLAAEARSFHITILKELANRK